MHRPQMRLMHHVKVAVDLFFCVEDLPALRTHVLSCTRVGRASAFHRLTRSIHL